MRPLRGSNPIELPTSSFLFLKSSTFPLMEDFQQIETLKKKRSIGVVFIERRYRRSSERWSDSRAEHVLIEWHVTD